MKKLSIITASLLMTTSIFSMENTDQSAVSKLQKISTSTTPSSNSCLRKVANAFGYYIVPAAVIVAVNPFMRTFHCNETSQEWNDYCDTFMDLTTAVGFMIPVGRIIYNKLQESVNEALLLKPR
jgi:hypothetical protein